MFAERARPDDDGKARATVGTRLANLPMVRVDGRRPRWRSDGTGSLPESTFGEGQRSPWLGRSTFVEQSGVKVLRRTMLRDAVRRPAVLVALVARLYGLGAEAASGLFGATFAVVVFLSRA